MAAWGRQARSCCSLLCACRSDTSRTGRAHTEGRDFDNSQCLCGLHSMCEAYLLCVSQGDWPPLVRYLGRRCCLLMTQAVTSCFVWWSRMSLGRSNKITKEGGAKPDAFEELVAGAIFDLQVQTDMKADLQDLFITSASEVDVGTGRKAIIIHVPFRLLKAFHRIQQRLIRELEKKMERFLFVELFFFGTHVRQTFGQ